jgi:hypothetical protein
MEGFCVLSIKSVFNVSFWKFNDSRGLAGVVDMALPEIPAEDPAAAVCLIGVIPAVLRRDAFRR